ncbi:hypothetical protein [Actomonas aquatica]|uniref:Lipocalin-like domain-containing protein n=1 Tax=Actomonas aquatica TaxID=2866162 RepID=A0ABZ1CAG5_9BACT|nr:hypothetical protein [Opitutus sp. WL0086]WRQ88677.1 hypothetical protein K1X11_004625 [Opitutus sp. WL0086]
MNRFRFLSLLTLGCILGAFAALRADDHKTARSWGPWEAIAFDEAVVQDVRVSGDDIFIKLQPDHRNDTLTMKISMQKGAGYRKWFTGEEVLVAQENSGRAANTWTDRIQTSASYLEYYANGKLFLHLKRKG